MEAAAAAEEEDEKLRIAKSCEDVLHVMGRSSVDFLSVHGHK